MVRQAKGVDGLGLRVSRNDLCAIAPLQVKYTLANQSVKASLSNHRGEPI
jgi:hypothetical protein